MRLWVLLALCACSSCHGQTLPDGAVILPGPMAKALLTQCSRSTPAPGEGTWMPGGSDIRALEAALPGALRNAASSDAGAAGTDFSHMRTKWNRQYVGLVRGGRRYIYGNFFPKNGLLSHEFHWRRTVTMVCDGGPSYFGVEWDATGGRFTELAFNGEA